MTLQFSLSRELPYVRYTQPDKEGPNLLWNVEDVCLIRISQIKLCKISFQIQRGSRITILGEPIFRVEDYLALFFWQHP